MNEFIEQFLLEAREYVTLAVADLLALEADPGDAARLDGAFRAVHTLKGSAGIVDFDAMARALHAAEDVLAGVRAGRLALTPHRVSATLACLDQVDGWLDRMADTGLPPDDADPAADAIVRSFAEDPAPSSPAAIVAPPPDRAADADWLPALCARHPEAAAAARTALRYVPDASCFFRHDDPVARIDALPGLLVLDLAPNGAWPETDDVDPFACQVVITALVQGDPETVADLLAPVRGQVEIQVPVRGTPSDGGPSAAPAGAGPRDLPVLARELLTAQIALLGEAGDQGRAGRWGAAGRAAAAVLRASGAPVAAVAVEQVFAAGSAGGTVEPLLAALRAARDGHLPAPVAAPAAREATVETVRVLRIEAARIDDLMTLAGELSVVTNAVGHTARLARGGTDAATLAGLLKDQHSLLERLVGQVQQAVVSLRVLPMRQVFQRFPRVVRDLALALGKPARLELSGEDTEADKTIVEALFEPLLHVVRNAMDHGLETGDARQAAGKPRVATVRLAAARAGDRVIVEVSDDGRGIDVARVRALATARDVRPAAEIAAMPDADVVDLIFAPGFSTAAQVSDLSGRGVGMDAVRAAVARLGGQVSVDSRAGAGTTVRFALPFTIIMTRVMTVEAAGQVFGLPLDAVLETVQVPRAHVQPVGAGRAFVLRDRTIPLIDLSRVLGVPGGPADGAVKVVVVAINGRLGGLEVNQLGERMDVMLKPLDGLLRDMPGVIGTSVMGDGRVLLVLDVDEVLR